LVKIRMANKTGTKEVSLDPEMGIDGFESGKKAKWIKENGQWILRLENGALTEMPVAKDSQIIKHEGENDA
jgi:hypothetical protein